MQSVGISVDWRPYVRLYPTVNTFVVWCGGERGVSGRWQVDKHKWWMASGGVANGKWLVADDEWWVADDEWRVADDDTFILVPTLNESVALPRLRSMNTMRSPEVTSPASFAVRIAWS